MIQLRSNLGVLLDRRIWILVLVSDCHANPAAEARTEDDIVARPLPKRRRIEFPGLVVVALGNVILLADLFQHVPDRTKACAEEQRPRDLLTRLVDRSRLATRLGPVRLELGLRRDGLVRLHFFRLIGRLLLARYRILLVLLRLILLRLLFRRVRLRLILGSRRVGRLFRLPLILRRLARLLGARSRLEIFESRPKILRRFVRGFSHYRHHLLPPSAQLVARFSDEFARERRRLLALRRHSELLHPRP
mmetsp:Transcript_3960/g.15319  ORF Transcript_3960/g.15319 Transcript_3960/m.15319 type:complete len:248 (-) Transcript_3960:107-850(-)